MRKFLEMNTSSLKLRILFSIKIEDSNRKKEAIKG